MTKQYSLVTKLRDLLDQTNSAVLEIRGLRGQLQALDKRLAADEASQPVREAARDLDKKMTEVEKQLIQTNATSSDDMTNYPVELDSRLAHLENAVDSADAAPTKGETELAGELEKSVGDVLAQWNDLKEKDLADLNELIAKNNIPAIGPTAKPAAKEAPPTQPQ